MDINKVDLLLKYILAADLTRTIFTRQELFKMVS
jgi:hypothetical protein